MTSHDEQAPRPTDPPIEGAPAPNGGDDTEGHMLNAELARTVAREHHREADRIARDTARAREAHKGDEGGFLKRFTRR